MSDLTDRLRALTTLRIGDVVTVDADVLREAADMIVALTAERDALNRTMDNLAENVVAANDRAYEAVALLRESMATTVRWNAVYAFLARIEEKP